MENIKENNTEQAGFSLFDPIVLMRDVLKRWYLVILMALFLGVAGYILTDMAYEPVYKTSMTFVVTNRSSTSTVYSNLSSTSSLAPVFEEMLNSSLLRKNILAELGTSWFDGTISAGVIPDTNLITVTVSASDPRTAFLVARTIVEHHGELTYQVVDNVSLEVLQAPVVPFAPSNSSGASARMKQMMVIGAALAVALLAWMSLSRDVVRSGKEARAKLDCHYLGEIPHENTYKTMMSRIKGKQSSILITNPATSFGYVETMRKIRHRVEQRMKGKKVLLVTSALEDEGKSTVSVNLALSMAQKHKKVLLIDCDLRKPACYSLLGITPVNGTVRDVIAGRKTPEQAIDYDEKLGIYTLLERKGSSDSGDLVASERMHDLIRWARKNFDFVLVDMPPVGAVSDAETVMEYVDGSLLVVRQNAAMVRSINRTVNALNAGRAKLVGCVVNNVYSSNLFSGEGYSRYGSYGKYDRYGKYGRYGSYGKYGRYGSYGHYARRSSQNER